MLLFYPLDQVSWELEGRKLNSDLRRKVFPANGTLVIKKVKNQRIRGLLQRLCNKQLFLQCTLHTTGSKANKTSVKNGHGSKQFLPEIKSYILGTF